jgi:DNA-binding transcriptional MocR family regulator
LHALLHNETVMNSLNLSSSPATQPRYVQMAARMADLIESGAFQPGQRLPSVRDAAAQEGVSISTAMQAFRWLEDKGLAQAKPKAGYFVNKLRKRIDLPMVGQPPAHSVPVERQSRTDVIRLDRAHAIQVNLGGTCPRDSMLFDEDRVRVAVSRATRVYRRTLVSYTNEAGTPALQNAVAQRALHLGCSLRGEDVVITSSCIHAVSLCLMAVTRPGDVVALESPTFFGFLDLLEALNLRVVEIPSHPRTGLSLPALQLALDTQPIKAVLAVPTLSNPLGAIMPLADKKALVRMLTPYKIPLIEDVVFNDLLASDERRKAVKSFDRDGSVMVCGSFSKTLAPGIRLGWVEAGRWKDQVAALQRVQGAATNEVLEYALADLLTQTAYESQMRRLSATMKSRLHEARRLVSGHFPKGTRVSDPAAGYTLWVELPQGMNSMRLFERAACEGIAFGPGQLFSATDRYVHCLRLSFSGAWGESEKTGLVRLGHLAQALWQEKPKV